MLSIEKGCTGMRGCSKHCEHDCLGEGRIVLLFRTRCAEVRPQGDIDVLSVGLDGEFSPAWC